MWHLRPGFRLKAFAREEMECERSRGRTLVMVVRDRARLVMGSDWRDTIESNREYERFVFARRPGRPGPRPTWERYPEEAIARVYAGGVVPGA